jgi:hypothetical protein
VSLSVPAVAASDAALDAETVPPTTVDLAAMDPNGVLEAARIALADYLSGFPDLEGNVLLSECPLEAVEDLLVDVGAIGRDAITADVNATIQVEEVEDPAEGTAPASTQVVKVGVVCDTDDSQEVRPAGMTGGVYGVGVGVFDYSVAPDVDLSEVALQFPDVVEPSADTLGFTGYRGCLGGNEETGTTQCYSWWERDRFIVGMYVTVDRETVDQSLTSVLEVSRPRIMTLLDRVKNGLPPADVVTPTTAATD